MEEDEFRRTYDELRELPCAFEKAVLNRRCGCSLVRRFNLGEREGVVCTSFPAQSNCRTLLALLRENARFVLHARLAPGALPHGRELKVQAGGLQGVRLLLAPDADPTVEDIHGLVSAARERFGRLEALPFTQVVRSIAAFELRRRGSRGR
jgi:hypothetical protein